MQKLLLRVESNLVVIFSDVGDYVQIFLLQRFVGYDLRVDTLIELCLKFELSEAVFLLVGPPEAEGLRVPFLLSLVIIDLKGNVPEGLIIILLSRYLPRLAESTQRSVYSQRSLGYNLGVFGTFLKQDFDHAKVARKLVEIRLCYRQYNEALIADLCSLNIQDSFRVWYFQNTFQMINVL